MAVQTITIHNVSAQIVSVMYNSTTLANSVTDVPYLKAGNLNIPPSKSIEIELSRIDLTQLDRLRTMGLLTYVTT